MQVQNALICFLAAALVAGITSLPLVTQTTSAETPSGYNQPAKSTPDGMNAPPR
ncbi:MAG: hypothetical protein ABSG96_04335 [Terracidiphilus sp.]